MPNTEIDCQRKSIPMTIGFQLLTISRFPSQIGSILCSSPLYKDPIIEMVCDHSIKPFHSIQ